MSGLFLETQVNVVVVVTIIAKEDVFKMVQSGSIKVNDLKFKLPSVTLANYGTAVPGKYGQIKKLQIVFTGRYEAYSILRVPLHLTVCLSSS